MRYLYSLLFVVGVLNTTAQGQDAKGDLYVLSVGVEPSLTAKGRNDPYALDAGHIGEAFAAAEPLYEHVHRRVLAGADASPGNVLGALAELVRRQRPEDLAVIHFSTHGSWDQKSGYGISLTKEGREWSSLNDKDFHRALAAARGRVIVLLDTCCAGGAIPRDKTALPNVSFLVACQRDEGSFGSGTSKNKPHGYFVVAAVEGLRGKADADKNGTVTFGELVGYLPVRTAEMNNEQHTVIRRRPQDGGLALAKVDPGVAPSDPAPAAPAGGDSRNPFGMPDVNRPFGKDVAEFSRATRVPGGADDPNAEAWAEVVVPETDNIDGRWSSRWKTTDGEWATGQAIVKSVEDRVFILYHDASGRYLIEARRAGQARLVGRFVNVSDENDESPWVGRIIANDRIDGLWPTGRWDLRRKWGEAQAKE